MCCYFLLQVWNEFKFVFEVVQINFLILDPDFLVGAGQWRSAFSECLLVCSGVYVDAVCSM